MTKEQYTQSNYQNEDHFTIATNRFLNANYPELRHLYFHVPNESNTDTATRIKLFNTGVLAGVPDFCFIFPYLWFIELKMHNGVISQKQKALHKLWKENGITVEVCRTASEVVEVIESKLKQNGKERTKSHAKKSNGSSND